METKMTDTQLEEELQDLYISSRHWLSDVSFVADEIRFFKDVISKYFKPDVESHQGAEMHHCKMMLSHMQINITSLKITVIAYLNFLGSYIDDPKKKIGIDLIEKHTLLENEIQILFESVRLLKAELFSLTQDIM